MRFKFLAWRDRMVIGYTTGVFDLFHIGHVNVLRNAKNMCDKLIVGVTTDELMLEYKKRKPVIPFEERCQILEAIRFVDVVISQETMNKFEVWEKIKFNIMFVGDDWFNTTKWKEYERKFVNVGVKIIYFPYTKGTSSTVINSIIDERRTSID